MNLLARVYTALLHLYPREFRDEFADEMKNVFADSISEAAQRGSVAITWICLRELRELPINLAFEHWTRFRKRSVIMHTPSEFDERPLSWLETAIGLVPFLLFGPVTTLLAYPYPYPEGSMSSWFAPNRGVLFVLCFLIGIVIGLMSGWQRWSFPYLGLGILVLGGGKVQVGCLLMLGAIAIPLVIILLHKRALHFLPSFFLRIRQDWTRVSFGLYILAAIAYCGIDHDEDPSLTILVILPGVVMVLSALAYLRSRSRSRRFWSLFLGLASTTAVSIVNHWFFILYGVILVTIIFLPAVLEFLPPQKKTMLTE